MKPQDAEACFLHQTPGGWFPHAASCAQAVNPGCRWYPRLLGPGWRAGLDLGKQEQKQILSVFKCLHPRQDSLGSFLSFPQGR